MSNLRFAFHRVLIRKSFFSPWYSRLSTGQQYSVVKILQINAHGFHPLLKFHIPVGCAAGI